MSSTPNKRRWVIAGLIGVVAAAGIGLFFRGGNRGDAHRKPDHYELTALTLNDGKKWATDAPLRGGMERIAALIAPFAEIGDGEGIDPDEAARIANGVRGEVNYLVSNCKLDPKADAALHVLIADMLIGADALSRPAPSSEGVRMIREALELYPQYFDHADWKPMEGSL